MKRALQFFTLLTLFCVAALGQLSAQEDCGCINCPVPIYNNNVSYAYLNTRVNGLNDLSQCPLEQVCFEITHTWIGDLSASLTSPDGTRYLVMADMNNDTLGCGTQYDNINICVNVGTDNPITNNTEYECNGPQWACLSGDDWTVPCGGVFDPRTGAEQAPNCDLNDFNTPGAVANGVWTLAVSDICPWNVGAIETFSLTFECGEACYDCYADAGNIVLDDVAACEGSDDLIIEVSPQWETEMPDESEYGYAYLLVQEDLILTVMDNIDLTAAPSGVYTVYGLSYNLDEANQLPNLVATYLSDLQANIPYCTEISEDFATITISGSSNPTQVALEKCAESCLTYNDIEYCQAGTYPLTFTNSIGCDSLVSLVISDINSAEPTEVELFVCEGECANYDGTDYCEEDTYEIVYMGVGGCDSLVELTVSYYQVPTPMPVTLSVCEGACTTFNNTEYCEGTHNIVLENQSWTGCDSLITLEVTPFATPVPTIVNLEKCSDSCIDYNGIEYCQAGTYPLTLENQSWEGCDSLVNVVVSNYILNTATSVTQYACLGECIDYNGVEYCVGNYDVTLTDASYNGCDSLVSLIVLPYATPAEMDLTIKKCIDDCVDYNGVEYCETGVYTVTLENQSWNGCDSLVNLTVMDYEVIETTNVELQICEGGCGTYNDTEYCQAGVYDVSLQSEAGCDSLVVLTVSYVTPQAVIVTPQNLSCTVNAVTLDATSSVGDTFAWTNEVGAIIGNEGTVSVSEAACYTLTVAYQGCENTAQICVQDDSEILGAVTLNAPDAVCVGEEVTYAVTPMEGATSYEWHLTGDVQIIDDSNDNEITVVWQTNGGTICAAAVNDCGAGEQTCLDVMPTAPTVALTGATTICDNGDVELTLSFTGVAPFTAVLNGETLTNLAAVSTHTVTVNETIEYTITEVTDANGCSTTTNESIEITVNETPIINLPQEAYVCNTNEPNDTHVINFNDLFFDNNLIPGTWEDTDGSNAVGSFPLLDFYNVLPGTYTFTFVSDNANSVCESVSATVEVVVENCSCPDGSFEGTSLCNNQAVIDLTSLQSEAVTGTWSITNTPTGNNPATITGAIFDATDADAGDYTVEFLLTGTLIEGCPTTWDAVITVSEAVYAGEDITLEFCQSENQVIDLFAQLNGADMGGTWSEISQTPTENNAFDAASGIVNTNEIYPGTYSFLYFLSTDVPCSIDSATVTVTVFPMPVANAGIEQTITCDESVLIVGGVAEEGLTYTWYSYDLFISNEANPEITESGLYTLTVENEFGCTATDEVMIESSASTPMAEIEVTPVGCYGEENGNIEITSTNGGVEPYLYSLDGENFSDVTNFDGLDAGVYTLTVQDANGCTSDIAFDITEPQGAEATIVAFTNEQTDPPTITLGESIDLEVFLNVDEESLTSVTWSNADVLDCDTCLAVTATPIQTTEFVVTIVANECQEITTTILVAVRKKYDVYIPTAFTPGDDDNGIFTIFAGDQAVRVHNFQIHDRWGENVFSATGFSPNDPSYGWDGKHKGRVVNSQVFVWFAEIEFSDGEIVVFKGDVTVVW